MIDWASILNDEQTAREFVGGVAHWLGQGTGPALTLIFGLLFAKKHGDWKTLLTEIFSAPPAAQRTAQDFHKEVKAAYESEKIRVLKKQRKIIQWALELPTLTNSSPAYRKAMSSFLELLDSRLNRGGNLEPLFQAASDALPQGQLSERDWNDLKKPVQTHSLLDLIAHPFPPRPTAPNNSRAKPLNF